MQLYLDSDGVLADFDSLASEVVGQKVNLTHDSDHIENFWEKIYAYPDFYSRLPLKHDAMELYNAVKHLNPVVLTGIPKFKKEEEWAVRQKKAWFQEKFPDINMLCCLSAYKCVYAKPGDILVDDRLQYRHLWREVGGIFVLHRGSLDTIEQLKTLKVI